MLAAGLLGTAVLAKPPVEVRPTPPAASAPITVYYERLPSGELRQVSSSPTTTLKSPDIRPVPAQPGIRFDAPAAPATFRPVTPQPVQFAPAPAAPSIAVYAEPTTPAEPAAKPITPVTPTQPVTYSYYKISGGAIQPVTYANGDASAKPPVPVMPPVTAQVAPPAAVVPSPKAPVAPPVPMMAQHLPTLPAMPASSPAPSPALTLPSMSAMLQQTPPPAGNDDTGKLSDFGVETEPPKLERLYRLESEAELRKRISTEIQKRPALPGGTPEKEVKFPDYKRLTDEEYVMRKAGGLIKQIEPNFVVHDRLYFTDLNSERYGWDFGMIQPLWSAGAAMKDFALFPYNYAARPHQRFEASAGHCYPGDPVPYLIYPMEMSATGAGWETLAFCAAFALIP